jgi:hypothetical protein
MTSSSRRRACARLAAVLLTLAAAVALLPAAAQAQATRTWIAGDADDANPCSRTAPCKTLAGAISKTAEGGEINAIDSGAAGAVTITKAITIDLSPTTGGILNSLTTGVTVNAGADDDVVLRGLDIEGGGIVNPTCAANGLNGIRLLNARTLRVEDVSIDRQQTSGLELVPAASDPKVVLDNVDITNACGTGVNAAPANAHTIDVLVRGGTISNSGTAIRAADGARVRLTGTTIFGNAFGLVTGGTGVIESCGDNRIVGNGTDAAPANGIANPVECNPAAPPPAIAPAPPPPPAAAVAEPEVAVIACTVPKLVGLTLAKATTRLTKAHCALGMVTRRRTNRSSRVGRVIAQGVASGFTGPRGAHVRLTVGRRTRSD